MKTLKELAANFNLFTFDDVPAKYRTNLDRVSQFSEPIPELPGLESGYFYTCTYDTDYNGKTTFYVQSHGSILCKHPDHDFMMRLSFDSRAKKYSFFLSWEEMRKYQDISTYLRDNALKGLDKPNMIGVFTAKKITDWVSYCAEYKRRLDALYDEVNEKNSGQVKELKDFAERMKNLGAEVRERMDGKNLTLQIDTGLFDVWIKHHADQNYIEKKIRFEGEIKDVEKITEKFLPKKS